MNSIDKGGRSGLQAAVAQAAHGDTFKTDLMSSGGKEPTEEMSYIVYDSLSSGPGDIPSDTLGKAVSNALKQFTWISIHIFSPSFKDILRCMLETAVCDVIEPAMGGGADPGFSLRHHSKATRKDLLEATGR